VEQLVYEALSGDTTLSAIFSGRVYPVLKPQHASLPAITYQRISGVVVGDITDGCQLQNARFQIDLWSSDYATIHGSTLQAVVDAMQSADGFKSYVLTPPLDDYEVDTEQYRVTIDFSVWER
jgi:hypothetical protein